MNRWISWAKELSKRFKKPMQVVWSEHGGYQIFSAKIGCSIGYKQIYETTEDGK